MSKVRVVIESDTPIKVRVSDDSLEQSGMDKLLEDVKAFREEGKACECRY